ncbi:MAG: hypothetical protein LC789_15300 [Actinobacteria bacterium]|nr:hypothetical protein [Actinomycetota bacterium]MCA1721646.1 hypothetical protein [Actinomycetota bacterium]
MIGGGWALYAQDQLPQPTRLERWVGNGGWLVDLLLPSTDAGVVAQAVVVAAVFALLIRPAHRAGLVQLWVGGAAFTGGLFVLRASH